LAIILAGRFDSTVQVLAVLKDLHTACFGHQEFTGYYLNPPGRYGLYPLGAERIAAPRPSLFPNGLPPVSGVWRQGDVDPEWYAPAQAAATASSSIPSADGASAYIASLSRSYGSDTGEIPGQIKPEPGAGPMVAICVDRPGTEQIARATLHRHGAHAIERVEGRWEDGGWKDFDLRAPTAALEDLL
jgi:hypothetical protein